MKKERKEDSFIKQPYYLGGDKELKEFVTSNLVYPELSQINKIEGFVNIRYDINHIGDVIDAKIVSGLDDACNDEAIRIVKMLKFVVPKTPRNLKVTFHKNIRIHFNLHHIPTSIDMPQVIPQQPDNAIQISYTLVSNQAKLVTNQETKSPNYSYIVKI
ncbi:MAG: energy transducer TonB [Saprospiraceae bacterium]|nr:energy transducer TonB [Saprospiraceae bacterium]